MDTEGNNKKRIITYKPPMVFSFGGNSICKFHAIARKKLCLLVPLIF